MENAKKLRDVLANNALTEEEQIRYIQQALDHSFEEGKQKGFDRYDLVMARVSSDVKAQARKSRDKHIKSFVDSIHGIIQMNKENKELDKGK